MTNLKFLFLIVHCTLVIDNCLSQWVLDSNGMGNKSVLSLAASGNNIFAGTLGYGVYLSANNGSSWTQTSLNTQNIWTLAVNGNSIFAGTGSNMGAYKSTNNGASWTQTSLNNQTVWSLAANGNNIFAGTDNNGVFFSSNSGTTWVQTSLNTHSVHTLAVNGNNIFAGTYNYGVYLSTNNGVTWAQTSLGNPVIVNSLAVNGKNIFAGTQLNGVSLSTNNGTTWTQTSLNNQYVRSLAVYGNNVFAGIQANGIFISNDNGTSWTQRNEGLGNASVDALCILNNFIFAGTEDGIINGFYSRPLGELIGIHPISSEVPTQFSLSQNYPNPFNPKTIINFQLPMFNYVSLKVYDILGREAAIIINQQLKPGTYEIDFDGSNYPSGVYYYKLSSGYYTETRKMVLLK